MSDNEESTEDILVGEESEGEEAKEGDKPKKKKKKSKDKESDGEKKKKKKKKKDGESGTDDEKELEIVESPVAEKKKKKKKKDGESGTDDEKELEMAESPVAEKKKKKKKKNGESGTDDEKELEIAESPVAEKKKKKKKKNGESDEQELETAESPGAVMSPRASSKGQSFDMLLSPSKAKKYTVEYFTDVLNEIREKCDKKIKIKDDVRDKFLETCNTFYEAWHAKWENEQWLNQLHEKKGAQEEIDEAQSYVDESNVTMPKLKKKCIKTALKIFDKLDAEKMDTLEDKLVKGAIIAQATPEGLADFAKEGRENEKLVKRLFSDAELMRDMLRFGGAAKYKYGNAMRIYAECVDTLSNSDKKMERLGKKIALACALELAATTREFDSSVEIDPVERFKHFEEAHRNGELDPAFPNFSVWEMRQIVNCDAPNDQMKWCRDMVMNYMPHITFITDPKLRYTYILGSDVRLRKPNWTASPRTYPMILSGGGNQSINSWFGRFILKSFGLPAWGAKERKFEGFCQWTEAGWEPMNGATWETCTWQGKTGEDFKIELEARNKAPQSEYWKKLVMLQTFADVVDGNPSSIPEEEKDVLHPERLWRSLSIISMELLFQTEPEVKRTFERTGKTLVESRNTKYLEMYVEDRPDAKISYKDGIVTFPASRFDYHFGNTMVIDSWTGGKQLNFLADGVVEYEVPKKTIAKTYTLTIEVCTVSAKQTPLSMKIDDADESEIQIQIPYTTGEWKTTDGIEVKVKAGTMLKFKRPKGSMGLAIKKFVLS